MNTSFSHALRVLICPACGAAMHVAVEGGEQACEVCDASHTLAPRVEAAPGSSSTAEAERLRKLRGADPALPGMPSHVRELTEASEGVQLRAESADAAMSAWQDARKRLQASSSADSAAFFHLTMLLFRHMKAQRDDLQLRAVLESAVEATSGRRDQQIFRCVLARAAIRAGDLPAAEDWVVACDDHSDDLHADGAFRYTAAYLATHKKQPRRVLELLGMRVGDVPLGNNLDVICSVLRANAHERLDDVEAATLELADCMGRVPRGAEQVEQVIRSTHDVVLCRKSFVRARKLHDTLAPPAGGANPQPGLPLRAALPWVVLSLFFFGLAVMTDPSSRLGGGQRFDLLFLVVAVASAVPLMVLALRRRRPPR